MKYDSMQPTAAYTLIEKARRREELRQENETFQLQKSQSERWFVLRLVVGYASVAALVLVLAVCVYVLMNTNVFPPAATISASAALFGDVVGLVATIWKVVLAPGTAALAPVTRTTPPPNSGDIWVSSAKPAPSSLRDGARKAKPKNAGARGGQEAGA